MAIGVRTTTVAIGFAIAIGLLLLVLSVVGVRETFAVIATANGAVLAGILIVVVLWTGVWSHTLALVLAVLDVERGPLDSVLLFGNLVFANSIAPSTYLGGEPLAALLLSRHTGSDYETSFAAVSSVDLLNYAPMLPLASIGLLYFATTAVLGRRIELVFVAVLAVIVSLVVGVVYGWRHRNGVINVAATLLGGVSVRMSAVVPGVRPIAPGTLQQHFELFVDEIGRVAADKHNVKRAFAYSTMGWLSLSAALWLALYAVGHTVSPEIVLFIVPLGAVTNVLPLPGGLGSVESVFIVLLVTTTGIPAAQATAATILYRAATYWLPLLFGIGAVSLSSAVVENRDPS